MNFESAFQGLKVADFSWAMTGPQTVKYLADYGATVVRIESEKRPCMQRVTEPYKDGVHGLNRSGFYAYLNSNKRSLALDMNHPRAHEMTRRLVEWADVVVENFAPGQMARWGLDYESIRKINPGVIMFSASTQGQTGPHAKAPGMGIHLMGSSGFIQLIGYPDRDPSPLPIAYTDNIGPRFGITALAAALAYREKTGVGQFLDLSQFEASLYFIGPLILDYTVNGRVANRAANASPCGAPHGVYRCLGEDRWCALAVFSEADWTSFCQAIGNPEWTRDARFSSLKARKEHEEELNELVGDWFALRSAEKAMEVLQQAGVAAGVVATAGEVFEDPQLRHRNCYWTLQHSEMGPYDHLGQTAILSETPARGYRAAPCLGEHTEMVCREILGITESEYRDLRDSGVFK